MVQTFGSVNHDQFSEVNDCAKFFVLIGFEFGEQKMKHASVIFFFFFPLDVQLSGSGDDKEFREHSRSDDAGRCVFGCV